MMVEKTCEKIEGMEARVEPIESDLSLVQTEGEVTIFKSYTILYTGFINPRII